MKVKMINKMGWIEGNHDLARFVNESLCKWYIVLHQMDIIVLKLL
ncbi:hypothetical protein IWX76_000928 [Pedobacter sp. CAN_A7]